MNKHRRPGVDGAIEPLNGVTRDGQPLSYNRAPAPDVAPWIARLYAASVDAPPDHRLSCGLFNDTTVIRIQTRGHWTALTADGVREYDRAALVFGPQSRLMPVTVTGGFTSVGISLRPGSGYALLKVKVAELVDRLVPAAEWALPVDAALTALEESNDPEDWLQTMEALFRRVAERTSGALPDPVTVRFEEVAFADPTMNISDFARDCGIDQRRLERIIRRDFGMAPKQVLRRARALDMASHLRGVADREEAEQLMLRYYDQSHLIRDFTALFGMSPRQFVRTPQPILTLALESRQAGRLEALARLSPGGTRPWQ